MLACDIIMSQQFAMIFPRAPYFVNLRTNPGSCPSHPEGEPGLLPATL